MPYTEVNKGQFKWEGDKLIHKPTGAEFSWSYPDSAADDVTANWKEAGNVLPSGEDYERDEIGAV